MIAVQMCLEERGAHRKNKFVCWKLRFLKPLRGFIDYFDGQVVEFSVVEVVFKLLELGGRILRMLLHLYQMIKLPPTSPSPS